MPDQKTKWTYCVGGFLLCWYQNFYLPPRHLVQFFFCRALDKMCIKWQYLAQNDQKCRFWTKFGRFWAKNLNFFEVSKSFGTNITENHLDNLSALFFGQALDQMGPKCQFWAKFGRFWAKNSIFWGQRVKILVPKLLL